MFESSRSNERSEKQFQYSLSSIATLLHFLGNTLPEQRTSSSRVVSPAVAVWHREQSIHPANATRLRIAPGASKPAEFIHGYVSVPLTFAPVANDATEKNSSKSSYTPLPQPPPKVFRQTCLPGSVSSKTGSKTSSRV